MRLLTHNSMRNNSLEADGKGYPLRITPVDVQVVDDPAAQNVGARELEFIKSALPNLDWNALVKAASEMGLSTLPPTVTEEMASNVAFQKALYHVLMNVRLVKGMLTCPVTGREFPVTNGIPNMMLAEAECEKVRL
mmetsp:Transcript_23487/g.65566  ORF Transcript_23487/g.65566 Transcript_23487/m.65566 type:complete len:136 (-) Transcript_23487:524-931(-)